MSLPVKFEGGRPHDASSFVFR